MKFQESISIVQKADYQVLQFLSIRECSLRNDILRKFEQLNIACLKIPKYTAI